MSNIYVSVAVLILWVVACFAYKLRRDQLDRNRAAKERNRRINAYSLCNNPPSLPTNVLPLEFRSPGPIDSGYPGVSPKHPEYHSTHADLWDLRERA